MSKLLCRYVDTVARHTLPKKGHFKQCRNYCTMSGSKIARSASLRVHRNLFLHLSRDGNLHGSGMSHATTASPKPILQGTLEVWRRRGRLRKCWTDNIKERTCLPVPELLTRASCRKDNNNKKRSLLNRPSCHQKPLHPDDPIGQGTELY